MGTEQVIAAAQEVLAKTPFIVFSTKNLEFSALAEAVKMLRSALDVHEAETPPATRLDGMPSSRTERELRRMLCIAQAGFSAYMDDGEASDCACLPFIDYMRDTPEQIREKRLKRTNPPTTEKAP